MYRVLQPLLGPGIDHREVTAAGPGHQTTLRLGPLTGPAPPPSGSAKAGRARARSPSERRKIGGPERSGAERRADSTIDAPTLNSGKRALLLSKSRSLHELDSSGSGYYRARRARRATKSAKLSPVDAQIHLAPSRHGKAIVYVQVQ